MNRKSNPKDVKSSQISIRLTSAELYRLEKMAKCDKTTRGSVIRTLIHKNKICNL
tara:strand:- start:549 stop:713 length:165 start_codon:yes stop_codon:yes gene_type:complete